MEEKPELTLAHEHYVILGVASALLFVLVIALSLVPFAIDGSESVPDSYVCMAGDGCNHFNVHVHHFGPLHFMVRGTSSNLQCRMGASSMREDILKTQRQAALCAKHWKFSHSIQLNRLSAFANGCINYPHGYSIKQCLCMEEALRDTGKFNTGQMTLFGTLLRNAKFERYYMGSLSSYQIQKKIYDYAVQNGLFNLCDMTFKLKEQPQAEEDHANTYRNY